MTATLTPAAETTSSSSTTSSSKSTTRRPLWRTGLRAGLTAAAATAAVAAVADACGVSFETAPGESIPAYAFAQLTLMCTAVGVFLARCLQRRARQPRSTFVRSTVALTVLSLVPDVILSASVATKATLILTHLVAAAIVIPMLSARLAVTGRDAA